MEFGCRVENAVMWLDNPSPMHNQTYLSSCLSELWLPANKLSPAQMWVVVSLCRCTTVMIARVAKVCLFGQSFFIIDYTQYNRVGLHHQTNKGSDPANRSGNNFTRVSLRGFLK